MTDVIVLRDLSFSYPEQAQPALDRINLRVGRGEMVAIMGPSGAGKSTLAKVLNRAIPAFHAGSLSGSVELLGMAMDGHGVADLAGRVALVAQDFEAQLFSTNVQQEVVFGLEQLGTEPHLIRQRAAEALARVGLAGFEQRDPATLSGGEKQRLAIAASLALQPDLLVFDEPTTDLDPAGKDEVLAVLADLRRSGTTLVVIEHEIRAAELADRLILLDAGRIVADAPSATLLADVGLLQRHAVRPPELASLASALAMTPVPGTVEAAIEGLRGYPGSAGVAAVGLDESKPAGGTPALLGGRPTAAVSGDGSKPLVELRDVRFAYGEGPRVLDGISLRIHPGESIALLGRNGSGKTTLAKHLNGLLRPTSGQVLLAGEELQRLPLARIAAHVGYVFQNPDVQIFADSVADEVAFGPRNLGLDAAAIAERVDTTLRAVGLEDVRDEDPFILSKGERQRLAVASLLALQPRVLVLDEPTTGLDDHEQQAMMQLVAQLRRGGTAVVMITHTPWIVAEHAERALVMDGGRLVFDGPVATLFEREDLLTAAHCRAPDACRIARGLGLPATGLPHLIAQLRGEATPCN